MVNKVDILSNDREVQEVVRFVGDSATRLLGVERSQVLPVSARNALEAKMTIGGGGMAGESRSPSLCERESRCRAGRGLMKAGGGEASRRCWKGRR